MLNNQRVIQVAVLLSPKDTFFLQEQLTGKRL